MSDWEALEKPIFNPLLITLGTGAGNETGMMTLPKSMPVIIANTNKDDIRRSAYSLLKNGGKPKETIYPVILGYDELHGTGAGSNLEIGLKCLQSSYPTKIKPLLSEYVNQKGVNLVCAFGSVGGGTGSNIPELIAQISEDFPDVTLIPMLLIPFRSEGTQQITRARNALKWVNRLGYSCTVFDNEKAMQMFQSKIGRPSIEEAMTYMDRWVSKWFSLMLDLLSMTHEARIRFDRRDVEVMWARNKDLSMVAYGDLAPTERIEKDHIIGDLNYLADVSARSTKMTSISYAALIALRTMHPELFNWIGEGIKQRYGADSNFKLYYIEEKRVAHTQISMIASGFNRHQLRPPL